MIGAKVVSSGIVGASRKLGVTYVHLWKVLTGRVSSIGLVLKIDSTMPSLFDLPCCRIDGRGIARENRRKYRWDIDEQRFVKKPVFDKRCKEYNGK